MSGIIGSKKYQIWVNAVYGKQNKLSWMQLIENYRIYQYIFDTHQAKALLFPGLDDVVVMNQRRTSKSNTVGTYARSRYIVAGTGNTNTTSSTLGDLVFICGGSPFITFSQISDPHGLARLVKSIKRNMASAQIGAPQEQQQQKHMPVIRKVDQAPSVQNSLTNSGNEEIAMTVTEKVCLQCSRANPKEARFCNGCGSKLPSTPICSKCGNSNPEGSAFCNKCGFALA
jgi:ribosomal protein L40E